jgi:hypothetical protein
VLVMIGKVLAEVAATDAGSEQTAHYAGACHRAALRAGRLG